MEEGKSPHEVSVKIFSSDIKRDEERFQLKETHTHFDDSIAPNLYSQIGRSDILYYLNCQLCNGLPNVAIFVMSGSK